ncbi:MAG: enoyl-CoA hydratase-related protein [Thermoplasmata archaeon]|nr:enoyl-CoA hydratase-related protein [Thermoplasmata archaeon]
MPSSGLIEERRGDVARIQFSRADRLNAFDAEAIRALRAALERIAREPKIRALVLTGEGKAFSAGGDVGTMEAHRRAGTLADAFHELTGELEFAIREIVGMPKPVVAALPGVAAGGGLSVALACDWRIASQHALIVPAFSGLGAVPDGGLTYFLPHFIGIGLTQELLFSPAKISADRAREMGLVHEIVPADRLQERAWERATELGAGPTRAYAATKRLLVSAYAATLESQLALERHLAVEAARGPELAEGVKAFTEKRKPRFPPVS